MNKFRNKYRIDTTRLKGHDYGSSGFYFVTICTKNRKYYFGDIPIENETGSDAKLQPTEIGQIAFNFWSEISKHYPFVAVDEFVIMPNHIHGILHFNNPEKTGWEPNKFGVQSKNLAAVVRAFKSSVKRYANQNNIPFEWLSRYHDSILRDERALKAVRRYIKNNPKKWALDALHKDATDKDAQLRVSTKNRVSTSQRKDAQLRVSTKNRVSTLNEKTHNCASQPLGDSTKKPLSDEEIHQLIKKETDDIINEKI
ncbi:MAG: transposase [Luteibaculaceae bacterium]